MLKKIFSILFLGLWSAGMIAQTDGYDPVSPPNPDAPTIETTYRLTTFTEPAQAGSTNVSGSSYTAGSSVYIYTNSNDGYVFKHWLKDGNVISNSSSFYYTMPESDAVLTAVYEYNPNSPDNPSPGDDVLTHTLTVKANPSQGGSFNYGSTQKIEVGQQISLYAYPNTHYAFKHWERNGRVLSSNRTYTFNMADMDMEIVGVFSYSPSSPKNPGANSWNAETGELIIDDFTSGSLPDAIYDVTNGNTSGVQTLIVNGQITDYDIGSMESYPFSMIDFSRCAGATYIPSWSFDGNSSLTSISLPPSITSIEYYSFSNCENLTSISCYATVPPTLGYNVFNGVKDRLVVFVPAASIDLYQEAEGWKDMTILPLQSQVSALEVNLPSGSDDGRFKNMFIELVNAKSGQRMRYVISDRTAYTFQNLMHNTTWNVYVKNATGQVLGQIEEIEIQAGDRSVTFQSLVEPQTIKAVVKNPGGEDVTDQLSFTWMKADGTYLGQGTSVSGILPIDNAAVILRATLPQALAMQYQLLPDSTYVVQSTDNIINQTLVALPKARLTGTVRDVLTNTALGGATVTVSQTLNGKYSKAFTTTTNAQGVFSIDAFDAPTSVTAVATDYISKTVAYEALALTDGVATLDDIALKSINGATITLNFTYTESAVAGTQGETQAFFGDYHNVAYTIRDITTGLDIQEFNVQYPQIVLLEDVALGDSLQLTATSKTGAFTPVVAKSKVDNMNRASVTFDIKQLGQISATFVSTENVSVNGILYDGKGKFVKSAAYSNANLSFTELADGDYTLVTMGSSKLFNTIYDLSKFAQAGLVEGKDYVSSKVKVQSGLISIVKTAYVPFFDESKLYYTGDHTSFTVNKTQITAGNYLTLNSRIDFKQLYANGISDVKLIVDLPESCSLVDNSVMVGSSTSTYLNDGNRVTIPISAIGDRIRFCVIPTAGGDYAPSAYAQFTYHGQEVTQPIGQANFTVKDLSISVPSVVAKKNITVSGTASGKSQVWIYDGDVLVGQTTTLANGTWTTTCDLYEPENRSTHYISAKVTTLQGLNLQSETMVCSYDEEAVIVNSVTMYFYNGWLRKNIEVVFDLENGKNSESSYMFYTTTDFTFLIDISYHDVKLIPFVWLHVFTSDGDVRSFKAEYDKRRDRWVATARFSGDALPTRVSVTLENMTYDFSDESTFEKQIEENIGDINLKESTEDEDGKTTYTYTDGNGDDLAEVEIYESDSTPEEISDEFEKDGFEEIPLDTLSQYMPTEDDDILPDSMKALRDSVGTIIIVGKNPPPGSGGGGGSGRSYVVIIRLIKEEDGYTTVERISHEMTGEWTELYRQYFDEEKCLLIAEKKHYVKYLDEYVITEISTLVAYTLFVDYTKLPQGIRIPRKEILSTLSRMRFTWKQYLTCTIETFAYPQDCTPPPPPPPPTPIVPPIDPIHDPSGYVYEGVPSNRLEGVTATAYYKETGEDMYGDPYEKEVLWDAAEYAQENPLFTDEYGMYAWDVPQGLWRVKFEKEGYVTTYSEWLPVPPPQLDVNIAMTQARQPEVLGAKAYEDGVEVEFDKYMLPESLTTETIIVKRNGTQVPNATIELLNGESSDENNENGPQLASKVKYVVPEGTKLLSTDEITVIVTTGAKSYAGVPLQETYSQTFDVEKAVREISTDAQLSVLYEATRQLTVSALPADAALGKTLRIRPLSTMIADISGEGLVLQEDGSSTIALNNDGQATITVSGELPGSTALQFSIDDTSVEGQTLVKVEQAASLVTPNPRASRASGTAVYRGTLISLSCENENAKIWYTLDGTCPCEPATALVYSQPIAINDDAVTIKAMAQAEGFEDSEVVTFEFTAKQNVQELALVEGWNWISHNVANNIAVGDLSEKTLEIKSQTRSVIRDVQLGLFGNLHELTPIEAYKVKASEAVAVPVNGDAYNATKGVINLHKGWNWLGYPLDQMMTPGEALANLSASDGDVLVSKTGGSADYNNGQWIGDLEVMTPGQGYMLKTQNAAELLYNTSIVSNAVSQVRGRLILNQAPWSVDEHRYPNVMPMRAQLFREETLTEEGEFTVAAFAGTECRGIGKFVQGVIFLSVQGEGMEEISFLAANNTTEDIVDINEKLSFTPDVVGSFREPYALHLGKEADGIEEHYNQLGVWPTMATTEINVSLGGKAIDRLTLTGMDGKMVFISTSGAPQQTIRVSNLPAGIYIVAAQSCNEFFYRKVMKVNK